jgi:hypothetical protein
MHYTETSNTGRADGRTTAQVLRQPVVAAYLDPDIARRAWTLAKGTGRSLSSIINDAVKLYFARLDLLASIHRVNSGSFGRADTKGAL